MAEKTLLAKVKTGTVEISGESVYRVQYPDGTELYCISAQIAAEKCREYNEEIAKELKIGGYKP